MFIAEKGISGIEIVPVDINAGAHRTPEFLRHSPYAQIPTLVLDDGRALTESRAICTYLEGLAPEPNLMGGDAFERAEIEMWDRRVELMLMLPLAMWTRHGHPGLLPLEPEQFPEVSANGARGVARMTDRLEVRLAQSAFVAGARFTIADITLFCTLEFGRLMKHKPWESMPAIARWRDGMLERPSAKV
jgi:glutathione S-transferase